MLLEFKGGRQVCYRVNPQHGGNVETVREVYAADYFHDMDGDLRRSPVAGTDKTTAATTTGNNAAAAQSKLLRRRVQNTLERIFLPSGYPNSVTDDLLNFALWDAAQVLANNIMATLSVRAVLLGVGVGESGANLTSSTLSWMMRDGTWLIGSIFFASVISQDLEYRAKSWRLVADFTNDAATFLELCAPLIPGGQLTFRLVVVVASVIKALVGVCGAGTRASFTQHFALRSNAADVAAKAGTRGNVGSLIGLALGMAVAYLVPASATVLNLVVFTLSTVAHLFANYKGVRGVQLRHLNAPRLEWCVEQYCRYHEQCIVTHKKDDGDRAGRAAAAPAAPVLDISVRRANAEEPLFILPALRAPPPPDARGLEKVYLLVRQYVCPASLQLRLHCGASFQKVLSAQHDLPATQKQELVNQVESALSTYGVALLFDEVAVSYYVILPEFFTVEGVPESWVRYKRQYEEAKKEEEKKARHHQHRHSLPKKTPTGNEDDKAEGDDACPSATEEADAEALAEMERLRKERVVVPPHVLPLPYRELWAFFYAYMHHRTFVQRHERAPAALTKKADGSAHSSTTSAAPVQRLHVITRLRADGRREGEDEGSGAASAGRRKSSGAVLVPMVPSAFEEMTSPTSTTSAKYKAFPSTATGAGAESAEAALAQQDGLYPLFIEFVRGLRKTGWELDRLLIDNEGCTTVVHYM